MSTSVLSLADQLPPVDTPDNPLSDAATDELHALRAALDARYAALESALRNPDECDALESLVLDLARVATEEAEAASRRAILDAQRDALAQTSAARAAAQTSLDAQRAASAAMRAGLEQARTALEAERARAAALSEELEHLHERFTSEQAEGRTHLHRAEQLQSALKAEVASVAALRATVEDMRRVADTERAVVAQLRRELDAATEAADKERAAAAAHRAEADHAHAAAAAQRAEADQARAAAESERADIADLRREIERAQQTIGTERAATAAHRNDAKKAYAELESERATSNTLRAAVREAEHRLVTIETDAKAELTTLRQQLSAAEIDHRAAIAALHEKLAATEQELRGTRQEAEARVNEITSMRARTDALEQQGRHAEHAAKDVEARFQALSRDRDALVERLESARLESSSASAEVIARIQTLDASCKKLEKACREAEARVEAATRERDKVAAERDALQRSAHAQEVDEQKRAEHLAQALETAEQRIRELEQIAQNASHSTSSDLDLPDDAVEVSLDDPIEEEQEAEPIDVQPIAPPPTPVAPPPAAANSPAKPASRHEFGQEIAIQIDEGPALLVNLSTSGAQVLSPVALKPNRVVRIVLPLEATTIACKGRVVWARLEASGSAGLQFRAGLAFTDVDEGAIHAFLTRHPAKN